MRFRLRYMQHDLELTEGEFAIGRSPSCQLSLDDPLVSRRHAVFRVTADTVLVEDLGSRNGVLVNGERVNGSAKLKSGDKVLIGTQELVLIQLAVEGVPQRFGSTTMALPRVTLARIAVDNEPDETTSTSRSTSVIGDALSLTKRIDGFRLLASVAEKALAMGRADEAERVLGPSLADVLDASRRGDVLPAPIAEHASRFAAKLATATGKAMWVNYSIEIYASVRRPAPAVVIDELYGALRKVTMTDVSKLKAYVETLRGLLPTFGPADRFLFQRIEGLERLATLRT